MLGEELESVWAYGSRARGEQIGPESDIDLMILTAGGRKRDDKRIHELLWRIALEEKADPVAFSLQVTTAEWVAGRREIRSFFIQDVDRDKVVLYGEP